MEDICAKAIDGVGGPTKLAAALSERGIKITSQAVSQWRRVPPDRAIDVERITGISRHDLRPDVFGPAPDATPSTTEAEAERAA